MYLQHLKSYMIKQALHLKPARKQLAFWLDLIKDIPVDQELPNWNLPEKLTAEIIKSWDAMLSALPKNVQSFVRYDQGAQGKSDCLSRIEKYQRIQGTLETLKRIIKHKSELAKGIWLNLTDIVPLASVYMRINEVGEIEFEKSPIMEVFNSVDADRIRECGNPKCKRIYWAGRIDQRCCCKKCANVLRVREWRENYQEIYKKNRIGKEERLDSGTTTTTVKCVSKKQVSRKRG
jgi:hypothetical protein